MSSVMSLYARFVGIVSGKLFEGLALLFTRFALGAIFWNSYKTKVVKGTWFQINDTQDYIFANDFAGVPLPTELAIPMTTYSEFLFPVLLALGLATRFSALALMIMALVIQVFVHPTWAHFFGWDIGVIALASVLISRGAGAISLDSLFCRMRRV